MDRELNILVAKEVFPPGLARARELAGDGLVDCITPFARDTILPKAQIAGRTVLFADFAPGNLSEMARLEWFQLGSAGYEQLQGLPLREMGVRVTIGSGVNDIPIAEWCVQMMLMFERDMLGLLENQRERVWDRSARFQSELWGRRVGILGYGNIGRHVARLCHCLGLEIWAMNRARECAPRPIGPRAHRFTVAGTGDPEGALPERTFTPDQMADFLPHLDYLILTLPLTPATRGILGERELRLMRPSAFLLNPSRGPLVEEFALLRALQEGWIAGAALDAHYQYPLPPEHLLWGLPNVILTPHVSGSSASRYYLARLWELFTCNLERYLGSQSLLNELSF